MFSRIINFDNALLTRSVFLFGARQTGKSTLLKQKFPDARYVNLLHADTFRELSNTPEKLRQSLTPQEKLIIIDEVQKLPSLLDEVHAIIEQRKDLRFILTGSNARKLRRGGVNLLAGRARTHYLFPLTWPEIGPSYFEKQICFGSIPSILLSDDPWSDLKEYVGVYLQEEIRAESITRSIEAFSRFLTVAGLSNGLQLNYSNIGNDAQVPPRTVREFFSILEDTLIGFSLPAYRKTKTRKAISTAKFYFFDIGVAHALQGTKEVYAGTVSFGRAFEHLIALEIRAFLSYKQMDIPFTYWRSTSQLEVDFLLDDKVAIEVKGTGKVHERDTKGLCALKDDIPHLRRIIVCLESERMLLSSGVEVIPLNEFLNDLWNGAII